MEEMTCVKLAAEGNADAFETLVMKYQGPIYNLCFRLTGNWEDAADMTQEAFLKAWNALPRFHFDSAFSTWLYRLASNACLDHLRYQKRHPGVSLTAEDGEGASQVMDVSDDAPTPEEAAIAAEERARLRRAMNALDPEQRQILTLRAINGLSYTDIADILDVKEGTVKSRLARARIALRNKFERMGNDSAFSPSKHQKG